MVTATASVAQNNGALNFSSSEIDAFLLDDTDTGKREKELYNKALSGSVDDCIQYLNSNPLITDSRKIKDRILSAAKTVEDYGKVANALPEKRTEADNKARGIVLLSSGVVEHGLGYSGSGGPKFVSNLEAYLKHFPQGNYVQEMRQFLEKEREMEWQKRQAETAAQQKREEEQRQAEIDAYYLKKLNDINAAQASENAKSPENWKQGYKVKYCKERKYMISYFDASDCIKGRIQAFNEDKSSFLIKVTSSHWSEFNDQRSYSGDHIWANPYGGWVLDQ